MEREKAWRAKFNAVGEKYQRANGWKKPAAIGDKARDAGGLFFCQAVDFGTEWPILKGKQGDPNPAVSP